MISILISARLDLSKIPQGPIGALAGITLVSVLVYGVCAYVSSALAHTAAYDVIYELRIRLMDKLAKLPFGYFTRTTQGQHQEDYVR